MRFRVQDMPGRRCGGLLLLGLLAGLPIALADTPGVAASAPGVARAGPGIEGLDIEWVTVGDPGNPPDAATGRGAVAGVYQISKHEITVAQYAAFLSAVAARDPYGLWHAGQKIERGGKDGAFTYTASNGHEREPVMMASFNDAMRFANWMHHLHALHCGPQATPSVADDVAPLTETGAYDLPAGRDLAARSPGARVWIPNEDEWYKAAYYQPHAAGGPPGHYWRFPTKSDAIPALGKPGDTGTNLASFLADATLLQNLTTKRGYNDVMPVGSFPGSTSYFGTVDQAGNAWEWVETIIFDTRRIMRGGSMCATYEWFLPQVRSNARPGRRYRDTGFRVARAVPAEIAAPAPPPAPAATAAPPPKPAS